MTAFKRKVVKVGGAFHGQEMNKENWPILWSIRNLMLWGSLKPFTAALCPTLLPLTHNARSAKCQSMLGNITASNTILKIAPHWLLLSRWIHTNSTWKCAWNIFPTNKNQLFEANNSVSHFVGTNMHSYNSAMTATMTKLTK